jgi:heme O synthase-like polyprenyltransferase
MPMPSIGIIVVFFFCGAGALFLLWVLYHFVLESTRRKTYRQSEWPLVTQERERDHAEKRTIVIVCAIACLCFQSVVAQSQCTVTSESLQQKVISLQRPMNNYRGPLELIAKERISSTPPIL